MTAWGEPSFYSFLDFSVIDTRLYEGLPTNEFGKYIYLIVFDDSDLEAPSSEPIGVYHYAGIRRYLWRDRYWSEHNIHIRYFMDRTKELLQTTEDKEEAIRYRKLLDHLKGMMDAALWLGSVDADNFGFGKEKVVKRPKYYRVIYKIDQKPD